MVAGGKTIAAEIQFARHADRHGLPVGIEHVDVAEIGEGRAIGDDAGEAGLGGDPRREVVDVEQVVIRGRLVLGVLVGLCFGAGGAIFQTTLRNPLASPDIIGITAGAEANYNRTESRSYTEGASSRPNRVTCGVIIPERASDRTSWSSGSVPQ